MRQGTAQQIARDAGTVCKAILVAGGIAVGVVAIKTLDAIVSTALQEWDRRSEQKRRAEREQREG